MHRLFRSHRTGEIIKAEFTRFSFPPRWHYDILRALDYFQGVDAAYDERLNDAIEIVRAGRRADGRWVLQNRYRGKTYFEMERVGAASRWNTLRALRVLKWWEGRKPAGDRTFCDEAHLTRSAAKTAALQNGAPRIRFLTQCQAGFA
jgi:hypothetical protein